MNKKHAHLIPVLRREAVASIIRKADTIRALMQMDESKYFKENF
jgi:hypothetical protein